MRDPARFRADRWARAGASKQKLAALAKKHAALDSDEQIIEGARVDRMSDVDLAQEIESKRHSGGDQDEKDSNGEPGEDG